MKIVMNSIKPSIFLLSLVTVAVLSAAITLYIDNSSEVKTQEQISITTSDTDLDGFLSNQNFIEGLNNELNLYDTDEVFRYVFSKLDDVTYIYPTENYYYFKFPTNGKVIWGTLNLSAHYEGFGSLGFSYIERGNDINAPAKIGGAANYSEADGVEINKIDDFNYNVTFENKTVLFKLHQLGLDPPKEARLASDEIFVEPTFDESGLGFYLMFNNATKHLFWVLNEQDYDNETFTSYGEDIVIGDRTGFAFYVDEENNRKILIGVYGLNVLQNSWYDGPFDQLLDNYVFTEQVEIQKYMEANDPDLAGTINKYGGLNEDPGMRVAVASYTDYFFKDDLKSVIDSCIDSKTRSEFYTCITTENHEQLSNPPYP